MTIYTDEEYSALLHLFFDLVNSRRNVKTTKENVWENDAQTLAVKLFYHLTAMKRLADAVKIKHDKGEFDFFDHASVKVVTRAAFETYLVFFYIFSSDNRELSKFRHKTWVLGGLSDRQKTHTMSDEAREKLKQEKKKIEALKVEISASNFLSEYVGKQASRLLEGEWKIGKGWNDLGKAAGFNEKYFKNLYGYLCGYSHSSYISAMQVGQAHGKEDQEKLARVMLGVGLILMGHFAFSYSAFSPEAKQVLIGNPEGQKLAEKWRFGEDDMKYP